MHSFKSLSNWKELALIVVVWTFHKLTLWAEQHLLCRLSLNSVVCLSQHIIQPCCHIYKQNKSTNNYDRQQKEDLFSFVIPEWAIFTKLAWTNRYPAIVNFNSSCRSVAHWSEKIGRQELQCHPLKKCLSIAHKKAVSQFISLYILVAISINISLTLCF